MMVILDTSLWIEFLRGNLPYRDEVFSLLEQRRILAVECVFGELLTGAVSEKERTILLSYWQNLPKIDETGLFIKAGLHAGRERLKDRGVGLIDALIVTAAIKTGYPVWTLDQKLKKVLPPDLVYPTV